MEEQILPYYLKISSLIFIVFTTFFLLLGNIVLIKNQVIKQDYIYIDKGQSLEKIVKKNFKNVSEVEIIFFKLYYFLNKIILSKYIHYGDFLINNDISLLNFYNIVSKPSNVLHKLTVIEGWSKQKLSNELKKIFKNDIVIEYDEIVADTYYVNKSEGVKFFKSKLKNIKINYLKKYEKNILLSKLNIKNIFVIASLLEKEGMNTIDKKLIFSVIMNRLNKGMRLQIDATVIYALTNGEYNLNRKLTYKDLKFKHPYNTYVISNLPPNPISYVSKDTIDLIFENYKSDFLFYFFNNRLNKHIFSKNFKEHKSKLNEYRNKK